MITIDRREAQQHPDIPDLIEIPFVVDTLDSADYAFLNYKSEPVGIERCEVGNLVQKLRSGELESQMLKCQASYSSIILLTEGVYDGVQGFLAIHREGGRGYFRNHIYPHTRYDYVIASLVRLSDMGIEIIHSPNFACSMTIIKIIYQQRTKPEEAHQLFRRVRVPKFPVKISSNPSVPRLLGLCPRMGEKVAVRLINRYSSIWAIASANEEELLEVEGFGKTLIKRFRDNLGVSDALQG